jgi:N6-adenosine-specific RNA methylase IME4
MAGEPAADDGGGAVIAMLNNMDRDPFAGLARGHYRAIAADPAWRFATFNEKGRNRCPDWRRFKGSPCRHYATMSLDEIKALPVGELAANDCALFLWATDPLLPQALEVMAAWGFAFKTVGFYWVKTNLKSPGYSIGCGFWTRANPEMCLLGVRGRPRRISKGVRKLVVSPRRGHSQKPVEVLDRIEQLVAGPYLELFARDRRAGWSAWGDEVLSAEEERAVDEIFAPLVSAGSVPPVGDLEHDYDPKDDLAKSIEFSYAQIRARVADGGEWWEPRPPGSRLVIGSSI